MTDLWTEASLDHEAMASEASLARADAELGEGVMPFLLAARSQREFEHRAALAYASISSIAADCGIDAGDLMATVARRYELYREALAEGQDPVAEMAGPIQGGSGFGSGPAKPYEHDEGPDFSGDYAEVPQGAPGGPDPAVTRPRPPMSGPVQEATGSLRRQAAGAPQAAMTPGYSPVPPDTGTGRGSVDTGMPSSSMSGMAPSLPAGLTGNGDDTVPITPPSIGRATSSADPVRRKVIAVTAAVAATNPHLPQSECERLGRVVVGRYLRHADLDGSVMNNDPVGDGSSQGGGNSSSGMNGAEEYMLGRQVLKAAPKILEAL